MIENNDYIIIDSKEFVDCFNFALFYNDDDVEYIQSLFEYFALQETPATKFYLRIIFYYNRFNYIHIQKKDMEISIIKVDDNYFYVYYTYGCNLNYNQGSYYYKCDQFSGLKKLINEL